MRSKIQRAVRARRFADTPVWADGVYQTPHSTKTNNRRPPTLSSKRIIDEVFEYKGVYADPKYSDIQLPLGLKWKVVGEHGDKPPLAGKELSNEALAAQLQQRAEKEPDVSKAVFTFSRIELEDFQVCDIELDHYMKVKCFKQVWSIGRY